MTGERRATPREILITAGILFLAGFFFFPSRGQAGGAVSQTRDVPAFHSVKVSGEANLRVTQGPRRELRLHGEQDVLDRYKADVRGGRLVIGIDSWKFWRLPQSPITVYVTMPDIRSLELSGSGSITGETPLAAKRLALEINGSGEIDLEVETDVLSSKISGSGEIRLRGRARHHSHQVSGSGGLKAFALATDTTAIKISGSGACELLVARELAGKIAGNGKILYRGNPRVVNVKTSGSGRIIKAEAE